MSFRRLLEAARRFVSAGVALVWDLGFFVSGALRQRRVPGWSSSGRERVLVVSPHPDDESIACSGTISNHVKAGDDVVIAIATDGRLSRQAPSRSEMASIRRQEAERAAGCLGVDRLEWLGLHEGAWHSTELSRRLAGLLEDYAPTIVYAPSRIDFHPEHLGVARALGTALRTVLTRAGRKPRIRIYQVQVPLTSVLTNYVVEISAALEESNGALNAYQSQAGSIEFVERLRRYSARLHGARGPVEAFWELTADQYVSMHDGSSLDSAGRFRGLRRFAWTDPLAYIVGASERRRLRALVTDVDGAKELGFE